MNTNKDKESILNTCCDFNWGNSMMDIPNEYFNKYDIYRMIDDTKTILVNQDEVLFPELQENVSNSK